MVQKKLFNHFYILVYTINSFFRKLLFTPPGDIHQNAKFEFNLSIISTMFYDVLYASVDNVKIINSYIRKALQRYTTPLSMLQYNLTSNAVESWLTKRF